MVLLLIICPIATADIGITDTLSGIIAGGFDRWLVNLADSFYEHGYRPEGASEYNGTTTEVFIYAVTTYTPDPTSHESVRDFIATTLLILGIFCFVYISVGAIYVLISMLSPERADILDGMLGRSTAFRATRMKEYFTNLAVMIGVLSCTATVMKVLFAVSYFITSFFIVSCFQVKSLSPSSDNVILYLMMALFYRVLQGAMEARALLLIIFVMCCFIIGALLISNWTRDTGLSIGWYFVGVLFLQPIIVILTTAGFIGVEVICADLGIVSGAAAEISLYTILLFILIGATISILIGLVRFRKAAVKTVKLAL